MPIYEYECVKCGERFEEFVHSRDSEKSKEADLKCPVCGALNPQRVYSTFGFGSCSGGSYSGSDSGSVSCG